MSDIPFRITSLEDGNIIKIVANGTPAPVLLEYRTAHNDEWQAYAIGTELILMNGYYVEFRNSTGRFSIGFNKYYYIQSTTTFNVSGNIMTLLDYNNLDSIPSDDYVFASLFKNSKVVDASQLELSSRTTNYMYSSAFDGCTLLTAAPILNCKYLRESCYSQMFFNCKSLTSLKIEADHIRRSSLVSLIANNNNIGTLYCKTTFCTPKNRSKIATILPTKWEIANYDFTGLVLTAEEDNSTVVMFDESDGAIGNFKLLKSTDNIEWTEWNKTTPIVFQNTGDKVMLKADGTNAAVATNKYGSYVGWRFAMTGKIAASGNIMSLLDGINYQDKDELTIANSYAFAKLFKDCASLVRAPDLPILTLSPACYYEMFDNCTNLTVAPYIPAVNTANECFSYMFYNCTSLSKIRMEIESFDSNSNMFYNVPSNGTFLCKSALGTLETIERGADKCPNGWNVVNTDVDMLNFTAMNSNSQIGLISSKYKWAMSLLKSTDFGVSWTTYEIDNYVDLNAGDTVCFKATTVNVSTSKNGSVEYANTFNLANGKFLCNGNLQSLLDGTNYNEMYEAKDMSHLFYGCSNLLTCPQIRTTMTTGACYKLLFRDCCSLQKADFILPSTLNGTGVFNYMFQGCTLLTAAPTLPATTLNASCYQGMFQDCTSLTQAPALPATTLYDYCYSSMFLNCTSLTKAPDLPATTLANKCYSGMFFDCKALESITYAANTFNSSYATNWLANNNIAGTFYYTDQTLDVGAIPRSGSGIPTKWSIAYKKPGPAYAFEINGRMVAELKINGKLVASLVRA